MRKVSTHKYRSHKAKKLARKAFHFLEPLSRKIDEKKKTEHKIFSVFPIIPLTCREHRRAYSLY